MNEYTKGRAVLHTGFHLTPRESKKFIENASRHDLGGFKIRSEKELESLSKEIVARLKG